MVQTVGQQYLSSNIENNEFSYQQAFNAVHKDFSSAKIGSYKDLDIRFVDKDSRVAVLIETKANFDRALKKAKEQLNAICRMSKFSQGIK